jgi:hypothetical protein
MILFAAWSLMIAGEWYLAALAFQRCRKSYPWFTALVGFMAFKSLGLFYIRTTLPPAAYFYPYYYSDLVVSFMQLGATVEVFGTLFRPFWTVPAKSMTTLTICTSGCITLVTKVSLTWQVQHFDGDMAFFRNVDRIVTCVIAVTLSAALLFARHFQMPFRSRLKGIATGLFIMSVTSVITTLAFSIMNLTLTNLLAFIPVLGHYLTLTVWIYHTEREEALVAVLDRSQLEEVRNLFSQLK